MKNEFLQVRISPQVKEALYKRAKSMGMSASEYVRTLIWEDIRKPICGRDDL